MKNETNTQHTPKLSASVIQLRPFIKDKAFGLDEVLGMIQKAINIEASELLKENEQLKNKIEQLEEQIEQRVDEKIEFIEQRKNMQALNAELLEALKAAKEEIIFYHVNTQVLPLGKETIEKVNSAIAKAETKTLVG